MVFKSHGGTGRSRRVQQQQWRGVEGGWCSVSHGTVRPGLDGVML